MPPDLKDDINIAAQDRKHYDAVTKPGARVTFEGMPGEVVKVGEDGQVIVRSDKTGQEVPVDYFDLEPLAEEAPREATREAPAVPGFKVSPDDIPLDLATRAHSGTSWTPEKRGAQERESYVKHMEDVHEKLSERAKTDEDRALVDSEMERYRQGYVERLRAYLSTKSGIVSSMIAGPSNFPARRMEKKNAAADNKLRDLIEFDKRAQAAMSRRLSDASDARRIEEAGGPAADLRNQIAAEEKTRAAMVTANKIIRAKGITEEAKIQRIVDDLGFSESTVRRIVTEKDFAGRLGFPDYELRSRAGKIERLKANLAKLERENPSGDRDAYSLKPASDIRPTEEPGYQIDREIAKIQDEEPTGGVSVGAAGKGAVPAHTLSRTLPPEDTLAGKAGKAWDEVRGHVSPTNMTPESKRAAGILVEEGAKRDLSNVRAAEKMKPALLAMDRLRDVGKAREVFDRMERGEDQRTPDLQRHADAIRAAQDASTAELAALGPDYAPSFIANYMPHLYKNVPIATAFFERKAGTAKGFLKERTYETRDEAIKAGLIPRTENPAENAMLRMTQQRKYVAAVRSLERLKSEGLVSVYDSETAAPQGWTRIDKSIEGAYGAKLAPGEYLAAPEPVARLMNRAMAPGLDGSATFRTVRAANALLNQAQLGVSAFHAWASLGNRFKARLALGLKEMAQAGIEPEMGESRVARFGSGALNVAKSFNPALGWTRARQMMSDAAAGIDSPDIQKAMMGGFRFTLDKDYSVGMATAFRRSLAQGDVKKSVGTAIPALMETLSRPLMKELVPTLKAATYLEYFESEARRLGPNATEAQLRQVARRAEDETSNLLGLLPYESTFWNKSGRQIAQLLIRSVGWRGGTLRAGLGGAKDLLTAPSRFKEAKAGKAAGNLADPVVTERMAYLPAEVIGSALIGSLYAFVISKATGYVSDPKEWKDRFFPKTGGQNKSGTPERIVPPGYIKDAYAYFHDPAGSLISGESPVASITHDVVTGKDYRDQPIRNPAASPPLQALQTAEHVGRQIIPFSVRQGLGMDNPNPRTKISPLGRQFGAPAPAYISFPDSMERRGEQQFIRSTRDRLYSPRR